MEVMNDKEYSEWIGGIARRFKQSQIKDAETNGFASYAEAQKTLFSKIAFFGNKQLLIFTACK